ncbi:hypothetical protein CMV00_02095 [Elizabethkingia anophelis]|nr:hypothetical protein [Elizabethkingia anophelis]
MTTTLPTDDLKKYGIIDTDNSFSKKLSAEDIQNFLQGATIIADNDKNRITFQLTDHNSKLKVNVFERDKNISELLLSSKNEIQYTDTFSKYNINDEKNAAQLNWTKAIFIFDDKNKAIIEYDMIKNASLITKLIAEKNEPKETHRYKYELLKLKEFLQEKIDKYPEIAKDITNDLNIVTNEINAVNSISPDEKQARKDEKRDIQLGVNDPDMFEDVNRHRQEEHQEQEEEIYKSRGFRR